MLVVTRYVNQVKNEKRSARNSRLDNEEAFRLVPNTKNKARYSALPSPGLDAIYHRNSMAEFNPYDEVAGPSHSPGPSDAYDSNPPPPIEAGYGGGLWTHQDISEEEKARMKRMDAEVGIVPTPEVDEEEKDMRRQEIKLPNGTPPSTRRREVEDLPRYTLSDPPRGR